MSKNISAKIFTNDKTVVEFFSRYGNVEESESEICLDWGEGESGIIQKIHLEGKEGYPTKAVYYFTMKDGPGFSADTLKREAKRNLYKRDFIAEYY